LTNIDEMSNHGLATRATVAGRERAKHAMIAD
jgi:hypothetical protein